MKQKSECLWRQHKVSSTIFNCSYPVWISGVECNDTYQHILRCNYTDVPNPNTASHTDDVHLNCCKCYQQVYIIMPVCFELLMLSY